ncbi:unnamed protein product [Rangifer tarandus platyrhynchus]|uniref:Uncharacterized protein n=1 Tax=Rangifer tarandus platyrhynchus TaxID=3082113 RepID=A0AC59ZF49_RANTA
MSAGSTCQPGGLVSRSAGDSPGLLPGATGHSPKRSSAPQKGTRGSLPGARKPMTEANLEPRSGPWQSGLLGLGPGAVSGQALPREKPACDPASRAHLWEEAARVLGEDC